MKILIITDYNNKTWIWSFNYNLYEWFKHKWYDAKIINLVSNQWYKFTPDYWINIISDTFKRPTLNFAYGVFYIFKKQLNKHLKNHKYDFVLLGHQWLAYLYDVLHRNCHDYGIITLDLFTLYKNLKDNKISNFIYNTLMLRKLKKFTNIPCISNFTLLDYKRLIDNSPYKNLVCIHNGFNITPTILSDHDKEKFKHIYGVQWKKIILHVWSEEERKNIWTFLKIAAEYKHNKDILFVRIWRESDFSKKFIQEHALHNIKYFSWLSIDDLNKIYSIANLYLYTSTLEGFWRPLMEAYLNNLVSVSSKVSDMDTIFKQSKNVYFVSDPYVVKEYIQLIDSHINDGFVPEHIDLSLDREVDAYIAFIKKCISKY